MSEEAPKVTSSNSALIAGPTLFVLVLLVRWAGLAPDGWSPEAMIVGGLTLWMGTWWIFEAIPLGATALLPLAVLPLAGVMPVKLVAKPYMHPFILLLMAGFIAALAIERWGLHKRVALSILVRSRGGPSGLILGMMVTTAICSMWISNTATTLMLLPIALALVSRAEDEAGADDPGVKAFSLAMFLGIAYSASIGGLATPIGTPPNLVFLGVYHETFPDRPPITFGDWMVMAAPLVIVLIPAFWFLLTRVISKVPAELPVAGRPILQAELDGLGPTSRDEQRVGLVFMSMAALWITRKIKVGGGEIIGWAPALGIDGFVDDSTVAVVGALVLFAWPSSTRPGQRLMDWPTAKRIPWEVVLLFGGGIALADAFKTSGLSTSVAESLTGLAGLHALVLIGVIALAVTFLTEVTSNTATSTILMPVLAAFATAAGLAPEVVMVPAVLSASCAFMLPVATAPNAIVYGSGRVPIRAMVRTGIVLNLVGAVAITLWCYATL
jgi:sodium-dependent dicarboxylate transporter 2/3/5